jgi:hypothetical protein
MARKSAKLQRRHTLGDVIRQYIAASGELPGRDPGRLSPLRMWDSVLGGKLMDNSPPTKSPRCWRCTPSSRCAASPAVTPPRDDALLFPSERKPDQPFSVASSYKAFVRKVGIVVNTRLHDLGHTAGTTFANEGRSAKEIQALLGHKTLAMVPRYTRVQPHAKARAFNESALSKLK